MFCKNCGNDIAEDTIFCPKCGTKITEVSTITENSNISENNSLDEKTKGSSLDKKKIGFIAVAVLLIVIIVVAATVVSRNIKINKLVQTYMSLVEEEKYDDAKNYYTTNMAEDSFVKKANEIILTYYNKCIETEDIEKAAELVNNEVLTANDGDNAIENAIATIAEQKNKYLDNSIETEEALRIINLYKSFSDEGIVSEISEDTRIINDVAKSRENYSSGIEYYDAKDYENAVAKFSAVVEEDTNYDDTQQKLNEIIPLYKQEVFEYVDKAVKGNNYSTTITKLKTLQHYCDDEDIADKISEVEKQKKKYDEEQERIAKEKMKEEREKAEKEQEVEIVSCQIKDNGYFYVRYALNATIKNNTDKTAKDIKVEYLLYNSNGKPSKYYGLTNLVSCNYDNQNIKPGSKGGNEWYFEEGNLPNDATKCRACVRSVVYEDGKTWNNPYYTYWIQEYEKNYDGVTK